ncbi:hypothetical protein ACFQU9_16500 [Actinomadura namibiensis]|uniref:Roadblock/LAMTOR2 domain-containing protein n=1 Tax=Actinomadura namibiensis TaxID=182080 RepID=A0A7W3LS19_ACTNM|nr:MULTISPECIES: hypothetical protein [Actinomadura]MBA8953253.1 hypothetical protein [Actinomadura namibiensis]
MEIPGARNVTLVDGSSGLAVAAAGRAEPVDQHETAAGTTEVVRAVMATPALSATASGDAIDEIIVCGAGGYHLLALVGTAFDGNLFLHLLIDRDKGNLALARIRLKEIIGELAEAGDAR